MEIAGIDIQTPRRRETILRVIMEASVSSLFAAALVFCIVRSFSVPVDGTLIALVGLVTALVAELSGIVAKHDKAGVLVVSILILLAALIMWSRMVGGAEVFGNFLADGLGKTSSFRLKQYTVGSTDEQSLDITLLTVITTALSTTAVCALIKIRSWLHVLAGIVLVLFLTELTGMKLPIVPYLVLAVSGVFTAAYCAGRKGWTRSNSQRMAFLTVLLAGGCFLIGITAAALVVSPAGYSRNDAVRTLSDSIDEKIHDLRYAGGINSLPDGRLDSLSKWKAEDKTALEVTMEDPQPLYLKGFVGGKLDGDGWKPLDEKKYYESDDMFYWLHNRGFHGNSQLTEARKTIDGKSKLADEEISMSVENKAASSEYLYLPYELISISADKEGKSPGLKDRADETAAARGAFGLRKYGLVTNAALAKDFPDLAAQAYLARDEKSDYAQNESWYNGFVYKNYTEISEGHQDLLKQELGYKGSQKKGHIDYYAAIKKITEYLDDNVIYTDLAEGPESGDLITTFLTKEKKGWAVHYAAAGTIMFRYYGIPARYVEGYLITPSDVSHAKASETNDGKASKTMEILASNGHAWTEIYVDGIGWVPIELTPKVRDIMPQPDYTKGLEADSTMVAKKPKEKETPLKTANPNPLKKIVTAAFLSLAQILLLLLIAFDIFALIFFLVTSLLRYRENRRRKIAFSAEDNKAAVCSMAGYMTSLAAYRSPWLTGSDIAGAEESLKKHYKGDLDKAYAGAMEIGRRARFSRHAVTDKEREKVQLAKDTILLQIQEQEKVWSRWIMKYIERLC